MEGESIGLEIGNNPAELNKPYQDKSDNQWRDGLGRELTLLPDGVFVRPDRRIVKTDGSFLGEKERPIQQNDGSWKFIFADVRLTQHESDLFEDRNGRFFDGFGNRILLPEDKPAIEEGTWVMSQSKLKLEPIEFKDHYGDFFSLEEGILYPKKEEEEEIFKKEHIKRPSFLEKQKISVLPDGRFDSNYGTLTPVVFRNTDKNIFVDKYGRIIGTSQKEKPVYGDQAEIDKKFDFNIANDLLTLREFSENNEIKSRETYENSLNEVLKILESKNGLKLEELANLPTFVISDVHARKDFIANLMARKVKLDGKNFETIFDLLKNKKINVVVNGDGMHSEKIWNWTADSKDPNNPIYAINKEVVETIKEIHQSDQRWSEKEMNDVVRDEIWEFMQKSTDPKISNLVQQYKEIDKQIEQKLFTTETIRSMDTMKMIMDLKSAFPQNFHFGRGNHEDIDENLVGGIGKFDINQTEVIRKWIVQNYGEDLVAKWAKFEDLLPIIFQGKNFIVSHSAPDKVYTKKELTDGDSKTTIGLIWTENRPGHSKSINSQILMQNIKGIIANLGMNKDSFKGWLIGHRQIAGKFESQCDGRLIQICHDTRQLVAYISVDGKFIPELHIIDLLENKVTS